MSRFAIIIGVDHYENPAWRLTAAVDDALAFREWALGPGGVPPENVHLLLSPEPGREPSVPYEPADSDHIIDLIQTFQRGRGADGERLYFYYAGHGASAPGARDEVSILPSDVRVFPRDARRIIGFSELLPPLQECGPASQFFFVDACRDLLLEDFTRGVAPVVGRWRGPAVSEAPQRRAQYLLYATSPGGRALETGQGIFGRLLLQGLKGHPGALMWSQRELRYELRFSQLAEFVRTEVETQVKRLGGAWRQFLQLPEQDVPPGSSGQRDFVLERFTSEQVGKLPLRVRVNPGAARQTCDVAVLYYAPGGFEVPIQTVKPVPPDPLPFPVELQLAPGDYTLLAQAGKLGQARKPCALYRPQTVELTIAPDSGTWEPFSGEPFDPTSPPGELPKELTVRSHRDPYAQIVVIDPNHDEHTAIGEVTLPYPSAGIYRARFVLPESSSPEQTLEIRPGGPSTFTLDDIPLSLGVMQKEELQKFATHGPYGRYGVFMDPRGRLSFLWARYAFSMTHPRLASLLGFTAFADTFLAKGMDCGLQVILGTSGDQPLPGLSPPAMLTQSRLILRNGRTGHIAHEGSLGPFHSLQFAATWEQAVSPGPWILELSLPGLAPTRYALTALPNRLGILVVIADDSGAVEVQQYMAHRELQMRGPWHSERFGREPLQIWDLPHLEMAQRYMASRVDVPRHHLEPILEARYLDPLLGCIAGYALARENPRRLQEFFTHANRQGSNKSSVLQDMLNAYDLLPDVHVLAGLCEPEHQAAHFQRALERGLPLFADGLRILQQYTDGAGNPWFDEAIRRLLPGSLWTSWVVH